MHHRSSRSVRAQFEKLESRQLLSASYPTANQQYMLQLVNWARANPAAQAADLGISLNEGLPAGTISSSAKQPLAFNPNLTAAAQGHSQYMLNTQQFSHYEGSSDPGTQMRSAGYPFNGSWGWAQNIAWRGSTPNPPPVTQTVRQEDIDLFVDSSEAGRGHRVNMLNPNYQEVGIGVAAGKFQGYNAVLTTENFANQSQNSFLTGVAFNDSVTRDNFYEPGEGLGGVTIKAVRTDGATFSTSTWAAGGYSLQVPAGTYTVTATGGGLGGTVTYGNVYVGSQNVERDFTPAQAVATPVTTTPAPSPTPSPAPSTSGTSALSTFSAANFNSSYLASSNGSLTFNTNGAWAEYNNVNFGSGVSSFQTSLLLNSGQQVVLHIDSPTGQVIGTVGSGNGGWSTKTVGVSGVTGVHNLYLTLSGSGATTDVSWFKFA